MYTHTHTHIYIYICIYVCIAHHLPWNFQIFADRQTQGVESGWPKTRPCRRGSSLVDGWPTQRWDSDNTVLATDIYIYIHICNYMIGIFSL